MTKEEFEKLEVGALIQIGRKNYMLTSKGEFLAIRLLVFRMDEFIFISNLDQI